MKFITTITIVCLLISCTYPCAPSEGLIIEPVGFTSQQAGLLILKTYKKGSGFAALIDSVVIDSNVIRFNQTGDTLQMAAANGSVSMISKYDYRVIFPLTGNVFEITDIHEPQQQGKKGVNKIMCVNSIQSCSINGKKTSLTNEKVFLKK